MRFSAKRILAAGSYAALGTGALVWTGEVFTLSLWCVAFAVVSYAAAWTSVTKGRQRSAAVGFMLGAALFAVLLYAHQRRAPWFYLPSPSRLPTREVQPIEWYQRVIPTVRKQAEAGGVTYLTEFEEDYRSAQQIQSLNAMGVFIAGLFGYGLGLLVPFGRRASTPVPMR